MSTQRIPRDVSQGIYSTKALLHEEFIVDMCLSIDRHAFDKSNRQTFYCIAKGSVRRCDVTPYSSQLKALKAEPFLLDQTVWLRTTRVFRPSWLYPITRIGDFLLNCVVHFWSRNTQGVGTIRTNGLFVAGWSQAANHLSDSWFVLFM